MIKITTEQLAACIDQTLLKPETTCEQIRKLCDQALQFKFGAVCINPRWVMYASDILHVSPVKLGTVVGFPTGADTTKIKVAQARDAIHTGADEIDMVADLAAIMEDDHNYLQHQCRAVLRVCQSMRPPVILKVIIESALLNEKQKIGVCHTLQKTGVDFIKTSTGLHPAGGATVEDVTLLQAEAPLCKIKAAGGIRTALQALTMLEAGASRIGTSAGVSIIQEYQARMGE